MMLNLNKLNKLAANINGTRRTSFISQGKSKIKKKCGPLPKGDRELFRLGQKNPANQNNADIPEGLLNQLKNMNPRDIVNIIVNT